MARAPHLRVASERVDPWQGVQGTEEYDPEGFYVRSVNKHDHTTQTRVPMHPEVYSKITTMLAQGELLGTPITSYQAFMRDAAVHNMHRIAALTKNGALAEFAALQMHRARADQIAARHDELRKTVEEADERLDIAIKTNNTGYVGQLLDSYEPMIATLSEPYAGELETACKDARTWLRAKR